WLAGVKEIVKYLMKRWWGRLIMRIVQAEVMGIVFQTAMDALVQAIQIAEGRRKSWDANLTIQAVEVGALGGALHLPFNAIGHKLGHLLGEKLVAVFGKDAGKAAGEAAAEAAAQHPRRLGGKAVPPVA